jgi:hypothetical protein
LQIKKEHLSNRKWEEFFFQKKKNKKTGANYPHVGFKFTSKWHFLPVVNRMSKCTDDQEDFISLLLRVWRVYAIA